MINFVVEDGTGLPTATSYVSVAEADDIVALNIHGQTDWTALSSGSKQNLLMYVSRVLDSRTTWVGTKTVDTSGLEWPRTDVVDRYGNDVSTTAVPYNVRWAVVEWAKANIEIDKLSVARPENVLSEIKIDSIALKFADPINMALDQYKAPEIVTDLLRGLGVVRGSTRKVTFGNVLRK